jgi:hypothetical protein
VDRATRAPSNGDRGVGVHLSMQPGHQHEKAGRALKDVTTRERPQPLRQR